MSASTNNSKPTGNKSIDTASNSAESIGSKVSGAFSGRNLIVGLFTITSISLFVGSFVKMSSFVGSKDDWNVIQPQITLILGLTLGGTFALIVASGLYYTQDPAKTIYFILAMCCVSLGLSYAALAIAAISR